MDLNHPLAESVLVPLVTAFFLAGAIRWGLGEKTGVRHAASAVGFTLLLGLLLILGDPVWPASTGLQKLPLVFAVLLSAGIVIDVLTPNKMVTYGAGTLGIVMTVLWLSWPQFSGADLTVLLPIVAAALLMLGSLLALLQASATSVNRPSMVVMAALGVAGASFNAGSLVLFQLALAVAASVGGFALWNWPKPRLPFLASAVLTAGIGGFAVSLLTLLLTDIRPWALVPVALVFFTDAIARRLPSFGFQRPTIEPIYIAVLGALLALVASFLALTPSTGDELYYQ